MKRATQNTLVKWIIPGVVGGIIGGAVGFLGGVRREAAVSLDQMWLLVGGGIFILLLTAYDLIRSDELERRLYYIAMSTAFVGAGIVALVYGLLQRMGCPPLNAAWFAVVLVGFYIPAWWIAWYRHR